VLAPIKRLVQLFGSQAEIGYWTEIEGGGGSVSVVSVLFGGVTGKVLLQCLLYYPTHCVTVTTAVGPGVREEWRGDLYMERREGFGRVFHENRITRKGGKVNIKVVKGGYKNVD
jgi:hypothetical protein